MRVGGMSVAAKTEQDRESCIETPLWLVDRIRAALGGTIDLDPCTTPLNPCGATKFYAPPDDGILLPWNAQNIFINPPYGRTIAHWTDKATREASGRRIILLVPSRTDSAWFQWLAMNATAVLFYRGRIQFKDQKFMAKFPSAIFGLGHNLKDLADLGWMALA